MLQRCWRALRMHCAANQLVADRKRFRQMMLEQQQQNLLRYPERQLLKLNIDAGGVRSRMAIDKAIAAERAAPETTR